MKKRLLSMLMAVLMIASLVPATALAADAHADHDVLTVNIKMDTAKKQPGIEFAYCNTESYNNMQVGPSVPIAKKASYNDANYIVTELKVTPFAEAKDICVKHMNLKTMELQAASCTRPSIAVTYCADCGKAVNATGTNTPLVINWKNAGHTYSKFTVSMAPTCTKTGWGYTVCDKCGEPEFVRGSGPSMMGAEWYLTYNKAQGSVPSAMIDSANNMFAATNPGHQKNDKLVVATKDVYEDVWVQIAQVGHVESQLKYTGKVEATHADTINGKAVLKNNGDIEVVSLNNSMPKTAWVNVKVQGDGKTGTTYCPDCGDKIKDSVTADGLNKTHSMTLTQLGYAPYLDNQGNKHPGMTDKWHCNDCNKDFGGVEIAFSAYWKSEGASLPTGNTLAMGYVVGDTFTVGKKDATCTEKGSTGTTYVLKKNAAGNGVVWQIQTNAQETPALGHDLKKIESKAPTCTEIGWTCSNYYVCARNEKCSLYTEQNKTPYYQGTCTMEAMTNPYAVAKELVAPTCQTKGLSVFVCADCGKLMPFEGEVFVKDKEVPHTAGDPVNAKEATCTEVGYTGDKVCKWCGIMLEKGKEIPMKEHTVVDVAAVEATCTADGMTAGTKCSVCGTVLSGCEKIDKLGHDYKDGKCTRCGEKDPNYVAPEFKDAASIRDYAKDAVAWAAKEGIVKGDDNGNFLPTADITRQDFVTMLWRLKGSVASEKALTFGDKADIKDYAQTAVAWAVENGYIKGRDNGNFDPAAKITRAEIVAILNRIAENAKAEKAADFTDIATHWAKAAIAWAAEAGIVNGVGNNMFAPNDNASRQDTVVMLYKFVNLK